MPTIIGDSTWTSQPGYPEFKGETGRDSIVAKFTARRDTLAENIPAAGSTFYDERWPWLNGYALLRLTKRNVKPRNDGVHCDVTLEYTSPELEGFNTENGIMESFELEDREMSIPVEQHEKYLTQWNYRLIAKDTATEPGWWPTAKDTTISAADAKKYKWLKYGDQVPEGWSELRPAMKPGVESFIFPLCEVVWLRKSASKAELEGMATVLRGAKYTPRETFSVSGEWLCVSSTLRKDGKYWALTMRFRNSKTWDSDIYD